MVVGYWGSREESIDQCAARFHAFMAGLASSDPRLRSWYRRANSQLEALQSPFDVSDLGATVRLLEQGRNRREDNGEVISECGFRIGLWNGLDDQSSAGLSVRCGMHAPAGEMPVGVNDVILNGRFAATLADDVDLATRLLTCCVTSFDPWWGAVTSRTALTARMAGPAQPVVDWIVYVRRTIPAVPAPSARIVIDGHGTMIVVCPHPPDASRPEDVAAVRRIDALMKASPPNTEPRGGVG